MWGCREGMTATIAYTWFHLKSPVANAGFSSLHCMIITPVLIMETLIMVEG